MHTWTSCLVEVIECSCSPPIACCTKPQSVVQARRTLSCRCCSARLLACAHNHILIVRIPEILTFACADSTMSPPSLQAAYLQNHNRTHLAPTSRPGTTPALLPWNIQWTDIKANFPYTMAQPALPRSTDILRHPVQFPLGPRANMMAGTWPPLYSTDTSRIPTRT